MPAFDGGADSLYRIVQTEGAFVVKTLGVLTNFTIASAAFDAAVKDRHGKTILLRKGKEILRSSGVGQ